MWPINFVRLTAEQECNLHHVLQERFIDKPDTSRKMGINNQEFKKIIDLKIRSRWQ